MQKEKSPDDHKSYWVGIVGNQQEDSIFILSRQVEKWRGISWDREDACTMS